jgi:hypothetical protein
LGPAPGEDHRCPIRGSRLPWDDGLRTFPPSTSSPIRASEEGFLGSSGPLRRDGPAFRSYFSVRAGSGKQSSKTPTPGQPKFGSCWQIENYYQKVVGWNPLPLTDTHPMACVEDGDPKTLRLQVTVLAIPRSSHESNRDSHDSKVVYTPAFVTPYLDREGWFLARYLKGVLTDEGFDRFQVARFRGDLPDEYCGKLRDALRIP